MKNIFKSVLSLAVFFFSVESHSSFRNQVLKIPSSIPLDPVDITSIQNVNINLTDPLCIEISIGDKTFWCSPSILPPLPTAWAYNCTDTKPLS